MCSKKCTSSSDRVQLGATESAPQHRGQLQSNAAQPALHHQEKTQREVTTRWSCEVVEDLIESIPHYEQMINSIQVMM